jgi:hypothetical protein
MNTRRARIILLGAVLGFVCIPTLNVTHAQSGCPGGEDCRAYAITRLSDNNYTGVSGRIEWADPTIRDGGFSAQVLWIGGAEGTDYIEVGWRKPTGGAVQFYWGYVDSSGNWSGAKWQGTITTYETDYEIQHKTSDNKWHVYIAGSERGSAQLGVSSGSIDAGGEVTDFSSTEHNGMGRSGFHNLAYMEDHTGFWKWVGWDQQFQDYSYRVVPLGDNTFQTEGYNP